MAPPPLHGGVTLVIAVVARRRRHRCCTSGWRPSGGGGVGAGSAGISRARTLLIAGDTGYRIWGTGQIQPYLPYLERRLAPVPLFRIYCI